VAENVTVIIPQFRQSDLTLRCVGTLLEHHATQLQVIVVDDGSPKRELLALQQRNLENVEIVRTPTNRGVTHAWNRGAEFATAKHLIFLNNDVTTIGPWCERLIAPVHAGKCVMSGPKQRCEKRTPRHLQHLLANEAILEGWIRRTISSLFLGYRSATETRRVAAIWQRLTGSSQLVAHSSLSPHNIATSRSEEAMVS